MSLPARRRPVHESRPSAREGVIARPRPRPDDARPYAFPRVVRRTLTNGMGLVVAPATKLPVATVLAVIDAGAVADPAEREGLAQLTARALTEGAGSRDGAALADYAERLGASIEADANWDVATVRLTVLVPHLPQAIALLGDVLLEPALPSDEIERLKGERLAELLQLRVEPRGLADETLDRAVYAPTARYSQPAGGTERSVSGLSRDQVVAFYGERYHPGAVTLIVAGDVDALAVEQLSESAFRRWRGAVRGEAAAPDWAAPGGRRVHVVAKRDAPQSELRIGHVGLPRAHPDYFPVVVMNAILGGLFSSRINLNLREVHGYTYGARSGYDWRRWAGPFSVDAAVQREVTDAAVREVLHEIDRIRAEEVATAELSLATSFLDGVFPIRYETTDAVATALANLVVYGLPLDFYDTYRAEVRAVTRADVLRAARDHLHPDQLQLVAVGDAEAIRGKLEGLAFGPLTVYDDRGEPIG